MEEVMRSNDGLGAATRVTARSVSCITLRIVSFLLAFSLVLAAAACGGAGSTTETCRVTYDANGATAGIVPVDVNTYRPGDTVTVSSGLVLRRSGYAFSDWNTSSSGSGTSYAPGQTFRMGNASVTLFAQWAFVELAADDGMALDNFGWSVAVSDDGSTIVAGAYLKTIGSNVQQGAAYVFTRTGGGWTQAQRLTAADGASYTLFGQSVSISADGSTIIVGAGGIIAPIQTRGAAYVFRKSGSAWVQAQKITASDGGNGDGFGGSVAGSSDGVTLVVGASECAYVFTESGAAWIQVQKLLPSDGPGGFGGSVAASGDGTTIVIGASRRTIVFSEQGAAYVFTGSGGTWTQTQELVASDAAASDLFGRGIATSGSSIVVGAAGKGSQRGTAYLFTGSGSSWTQAEEIVAFDGAAGDAFGSSVALSRNGSIFVIGAPFKAIGSNPGQGAAYLQSQELTASDGAQGNAFGYSIAASGDGSTVVVGAPQKEFGTNGSEGAAVVFTKKGSTWSQ